MNRRVWIPLLMLAAALPGCDDPFVDPFRNESRWFTIWGWIDPAASVQKVRVIPVTRWPPEVTSSSDLNATIDARVFCIDLRSGTETEWTHRLERLDDGSLAHVFRGSPSITPGARFRLEVRRSDGRVTFAETRVPSALPVGAVQPGVPYESSEGHLLQDVTLQGVATPRSLRVKYLAENWLDKRDVWIDYGSAGRRNASGDWVVTIDLTADQVPLREDIAEGIRKGEIPGRDEFGNDMPFGLTQMGLRFQILNEGWELPDGPQDEEVYSRPDVLTNVTNGYGYWGAALSAIEQWGISSELSLRLGWDY